MACSVLADWLFSCVLATSVMMEEGRVRKKTAVLAWSMALLIALFGGTAEATSYDLATILGNSGFEDDLVHSQWTATLPNTTSGWSLIVPVNPVIDANGTLAPPCCVTAPAGSNFIGVKNPGSPAQDVKGKLAHEAETFAAIAGDIFTVTVFANRGRLDNQNTFGTASPPLLAVQFRGWNAGALPTVNPNTDDWSRTTTFLGASMSFTNWGALGDWTSQTFSWTTPSNLSYVSLTISGQNTNHDQYVAFDVAPVPEPATMFLGGLGLIAFGYAARRRLFGR